MKSKQYGLDGQSHEMEIKDVQQLGEYVSYLVGRYGSVKIARSEGYEFVFEIGEDKASR